ncbi:HAD family hydrolase [Inconstantimicrobium mannanitabidum]|uniref:Haloacid dehalogenase n=1 Tax=Inconstantimicrobium mannanitabidum TaxID=1604901 RepID=A0ACB5RHP6_9CLOT|nr:HAD family hydrolase [Clostridium sp. TW13]GKX68615.1 haloacid dehalogenase [Clostridium sp. TW13]
MGIFDGYLLVSDMDGTMLGTDRKISNENIEAIKYFIKEGGKFTIATGRTVESTRRYIDKYFKDIPLELPVGLYNGSKLYDFKNEKTVLELYLDDNEKEILKKIKQDYETLGLEIYSEERTYIYSSCRFTERFKTLNYDVCYEVPEYVWDKPWLKMLMVGEVEEIEDLEASFKERYGEANLLRTGENYLEVVPDKSSKGVLVEKICELYDYDIKKVIALGDNMNDLDMLSKSGYGFAVSNGNQRLLEQIELKAGTNDEHAIQHAVNYLKEHIKVHS